MDTRTGVLEELLDNVGKKAEEIDRKLQAVVTGLVALGIKITKQEDGSYGLKLPELDEIHKLNAILRQKSESK